MSADRNANRLSDATIVLTGATSGIGYATALRFAPLAGRLILHGPEPAERVSERLERVRAQMRPGAELLYFSADYGFLAEVTQLAGNIGAAADRIDLLVNNAGRPGPATRTLTADGNEATLQTNYLAPILLTTELAGPIGRSERGRVVNIASATHLSAQLPLDDLNLAHHHYAPEGAYAQSKLALVTYSLWLAAHRPSARLDIVSMHPGVIATPLLHAMFSIGGDRPEHAAGAILDVAAREGDNGTYYDEDRPAPPNPLAADPDMQMRLHEATLQMIGHAAPRLSGGRS